MNKTGKPRYRGQSVRGLKRETANVNLCLNPTTSPLKIQLFGSFDHDTKNAIIITAREVSGE